MPKRKWRPSPVMKGDVTYQRIWRAVDGAVADAFKMHPEYLGNPERVVRNSIVKRLTGVIRSFAGQPAKGRSGNQPSA